MTDLHATQATEQLHAAVADAQKLAAERLMEIEKLRECWAEALGNVATRNREIEQLRADISQAYNLRDKAEGRYCTALGEIERLREFIEKRCIGSGVIADAERWRLIKEWNKAKMAMSGEQP